MPKIKVPKRVKEEIKKRWTVIAKPRKVKKYKIKEWQTLT